MMDNVMDIINGIIIIMVLAMCTENTKTHTKPKLHYRKPAAAASNKKQKKKKVSK